MIPTPHHPLVRLLLGVAFWSASNTAGFAAETEAPALAAQEMGVKVQAPAVTPTTDNSAVLPLEQAVLQALENNSAFAVQRLGPALSQTAVGEARATFDPALSGSVSGRHSHDDQDYKREAENRQPDEAEIASELTLAQRLPTGTTVAASVSQDRVRGDYPHDDSASYDLAADLTITQSLLRGFGPAVNLATLRQARLDVAIADAELRAAAELLVQQTENAYWDCALAQRRIKIYEESLALAKQQRDEVHQKITAGILAETEKASADAEVALRQEDLINARAASAKAQLLLAHLIRPQGASRLASPVGVSDVPALPAVTLGSPEDHVALGHRERPELLQVRLKVSRGEIEVVRTANGLLPRLDFFINLGGSRYADSFSKDGDSNGRGRGISAGLELEYVLGARAEKARHERASLGLQQIREALVNLEDLIELDVRQALIDVGRFQEQIAATAATRKFREEAVRAETAKFKVGQSTSLLVAQAQRDLLASRISEVQAIVNCLQALTELYRQEGTLLNRRGIAAPGGVATPCQQ